MLRLLLIAQCAAHTWLSRGKALFATCTTSRAVAARWRMPACDGARQRQPSHQFLNILWLSVERRTDVAGALDDAATGLGL
jgi:hypothetical protein